MASISDPPACLLVVAALLSGIGIGLPVESAHAQDDCLTAPGAAAPAGQHWYYRTDRTKHRKCWSLRATVSAPNGSAAEPAAPPAQPAPAGAKPQAATVAPSPAPDAAPPLPAAPALRANTVAATAPARRWCAYFTGGPTRCDFTSFEECLAAIKGKTAVCVQKARDGRSAAPDSNAGG